MSQARANAGNGKATGAALEAALKLLDRRDMSVGQLVQRLKDRGFPAGEALEAAARLEELAIVDNKRIAAGVVDFGRSRGWARAKIEAELRKLKLATQVDDEVADSHLASETAKKWSLKHQNLPYEQAFRRLGGFLARRGYDFETAHEACLQALGEPPGSD
ncbi:MAG: regulatory protein RecX [Actinomycetota bacterium]